jgi:serine/threonine protein kinase
MMFASKNGQKVGEGAYGIVKKHVLPTGKIVAIKKFEASDRGIQESTLRELHALSVLKGYPHILEIITIENNVTDKGITNTVLVMPLYVGDLKNFIDQIPTSQRIKYFDVVLDQLLKGFYYMYQNGIIHRDIKPQNILVNYYYDTIENELSDEPRCYLADFGLARQLLCTPEFRQIDKTLEAYTVWYRPPEIFARVQTYNENADIWALGCTLVEYIAGIPLFQAKSYQEIEIIKVILKRLKNPLDPTAENLELFKTLSIHDSVDVPKFLMSATSPYHYENISKNTMDMLTSMLSFNYKERVSITDLVEPHSQPLTLFVQQRTSILSKDLNKRMYHILVDWLHELAKTFKLRLETFITGLDILNRYLSVDPNVKRIMFQLVGSVCLSLACKMQEIFSPDITDYVYHSDRTFDSQQFKLMEKTITEKLNYRMVTCDIDNLVASVKNFVESKYQLISPKQIQKLQFEILKQLFKDLESAHLYYIDMSYDEILNFLHETQFKNTDKKIMVGTNQSPKFLTTESNKFNTNSATELTIPMSPTRRSTQNFRSPNNLADKSASRAKIPLSPTRNISQKLSSPNKLNDFTDESIKKITTSMSPRKSIIQQPQSPNKIPVNFNSFTNEPTNKATSLRAQVKSRAQNPHLTKGSSGRRNTRQMPIKSKTAYIPKISTQKLSVTVPVTKRSTISTQKPQVMLKTTLPSTIKNAGKIKSPLYVSNVYQTQIQPPKVNKDTYVNTIMTTQTPFPHDTTSIIPSYPPETQVSDLPQISDTQTTSATNLKTNAPAEKGSRPLSPLLRSQSYSPQRK